MDSIFKRNAERKGVWLTVACVTPLILCLVFTFLDARQIVKRQQTVTAEMLLNQAEAISDRAWNMVGYLQEFSNQDCSEMITLLQQYASQYPYFRSIGVMRDNVVTCSSVYGGLKGELSTMLLNSVAVPDKASWMLSVAGTYAVKNRPAVIYMRNTAEGFSSYAVVEGQYLLDFMNAIGKSHGYIISLRFGGGFSIKSDFNPDMRASVLSTSTLVTRSSHYPVEATVISPPADLALTWRQGLITFLPMATILSLLLMVMTSNWLKRRLSIRDQLEQALRREEFSVNYQPVYDLKDGSCGGAEALMRWRLPNGNWAKPDLFIGAAEEAGMIIPLTQHLLRMIAKDARDWQVPQGFHIGINIAGEHIQHPDFIIDIREFAAEVDHLRPSITLELTERSLISDGEEVIRKLETLRREGIKIAIDDFGTGHCSLTYLQTFPLDYLKIDRGFVNAIESTEEETPVLDAIIALSHKLKLSIVAEGVEAPEQLEYLKARGVSYIQGYLYAKPMTSSDLVKWVRQQHASDVNDA